MGNNEEGVGIGNERGRRSRVCTLYRGREKMSVKMCVCVCVCRGRESNGSCIDSYIDHGLYVQ